jgi:hypothetical protein
LNRNLGFRFFHKLTFILNATAIRKLLHSTYPGFPHYPLA